MINMTFSELTTILGVAALEQTGAFTGLSKDTRTLLPGNLYIAIIGESLNGHDYINEALAKGAAAAVVSRRVNVNIPQIVVSDTLLALGKMSAVWRDRFSLPIVGVTGSNGKTTLKNMIASILAAACGGNSELVLATEGNLNNNIGVPLMLARLNPQHRYGVIEMGMNSFGEIAYLTNMTKPAVAVITNAAEAHLQGLQNVAGVAKAKGEIFSGLQKNGIAVFNKEDAHFDYWRGLLSGQAYLTFGLESSADVTGTYIPSKDTLHQLLNLHTPVGDLDVTLPLLGQHNVRNALAATAVAVALNIDLEAVKAGLEAVQPAPGRLNQHLLANGARVIDDSYNANPFSTTAAINTLALFSGKKILVLGDMRELGSEAEKLHADIGTKAQTAGIDQLFTLGDLSAAAARTFGDKAQHFTDRKILLDALKPYVENNTTILIKGSRSMHMENIVAGIVPENAMQVSH
jgi:UDP-N-acetylmuramoyl-tripeptide--D-alanyl-D-alanine ligase